VCTAWQTVAFSEKKGGRGKKGRSDPRMGESDWRKKERKILQEQFRGKKCVAIFPRRSVKDWCGLRAGRPVVEKRQSTGVKKSAENEIEKQRERQCKIRGGGREEGVYLGGERRGGESPGY